MASIKDFIAGQKTVAESLAETKASYAPGVSFGPEVTDRVKPDYTVGGQSFVGDKDYKFAPYENRPVGGISAPATPVDMIGVELRQWVLEFIARFDDADGVTSADELVKVARALENYLKNG